MNFWSYVLVAYLSVVALCRIALVGQRKMVQFSAGGAVFGLALLVVALLAVWPSA